MIQYHRVYAGSEKFHLSTAARQALTAEDPEAVNEAALQQMAARLNRRDYGPDCPPDTRRENEATLAAAYGHLTGFYRGGPDSRLLVLARQLPSPDQILITGEEYAALPTEAAPHAL